MSNPNRVRALISTFAQMNHTQFNRRDGAGYEVGVSFLDAEDVFRARMVAQVCYIEDYRRSIARAEGRELSSEEAAGEWIARYAHKFPGASGGLQ